MTCLACEEPTRYDDHTCGDEDLVLEDHHVKTMRGIAGFPAGVKANWLAQVTFVHPNAEWLRPVLRELAGLHMAEELGADRWRLTHQGERFLKVLDG